MNLNNTINNSAKDLPSLMYTPEPEEVALLEEQRSHHVRRQGWRGAFLRKINILLLTLLALQVATMVLTKRISLHMKNYPYTLTQMQPISTTSFFGILTIIQYVSLHYFVSDTTRRKYVQSTISMFSLAPGWYKFPKLKFLLLGVLFSLANFLIFSGSRGDYVSGPLSVLLQQAVVPVTFFMSWVFMRKKFQLLHYLGAAITLAGIVLSLWPSLRSVHENVERWWAVLLIVGSTIFTSGALTFIERYLKQDKMPFLYAWTWINVFEIIVTFPLLFAIIPIQGIPIDHTFENVQHGYNCLWKGTNYIAGDNCEHVGWWFLVFIVVLVANKINMTYVLRHGNVTLGMITLTCAVPIANICFTSKFIMGQGGEVQLNAYDIAGIILVCAGLIAYRIAKPAHKQRMIKFTDSDDSD